MHIHIHTDIYIYLYTYICMVHVCLSKLFPGRRGGEGLLYVVYIIHDGFHGCITSDPHSSTIYTLEQNFVVLVLCLFSRSLFLVVFLAICVCLSLSLSPSPSRSLH